MLSDERSVQGQVRRFRQAVVSVDLRSVALFFGIAAIYVGSGTYGGVQSKDTLTASLASWLLAAHHSLDFRNIAPYFAPGSLWLTHGAHGMIVSNRFPGAVLLAAPLYAIWGATYSAIPATLSAAFAAAGACTVLYRVFTRFQPGSVALAATGLFAFGTSQWTVAGRELWEHSGSTLLIALSMLALCNHRWTLAGLASGATLLFRPHLGIGALVLAIGLVVVERRIQPALRFGLGMLPGLAAYLTWNVLTYGHFTLTGGYTGETGVGPGGVGVLGFLDNLAGTVVSPERGLLVCSPILLLTLVGLPHAWRTVPPIVRVFTLGGLAYLASQLWLIRYSGGDGFYGYRTSLETLVWCSPLLVEAGRLGWRRAGTAVSVILAGASVALYAGGAFDLGETVYSVNPWTNWGPSLLIRDYGLMRFLIGAAIGAAAVMVVCLLSARQAANSDRRPTDESREANRLVRLVAPLSG